MSDRPGAHDFSLLARLALPDGRVLRAARPGAPTADCLYADPMRDGASLLKVQTVNEGGNALVAVFNLQGGSWSRATRRFEAHARNGPDALTAPVAPADVPGAASPTGRWAAWSDARRAAVEVCADGASPDASRLTVSLRRAQSDVITLAPVHALPCGARAAALGVTAMLNAGGTVRAAAPAGPSAFRITVRGRGLLAVWCDAPPGGATCDGESVSVAYDREAALAVVDLPPWGGGGGGAGGEAADAEVEVQF